MQWIPLTEGRFKILIKQPEILQPLTTQETLDLELGIFDIE